MDNKISMYQITKEMVINKLGKLNATSALIKTTNSNNCKLFIKVLNSVGIDENLFKEGTSFSFKTESKEAVKDLIENYNTYTELMQHHPGDRDTVNLDAFIKQLHIILKNEVEDESILQSQLAKIELVTFNRIQQLNTYLKKLAIPTFDKILSVADIEILQMYYIEEMIQLKEKIEEIQDIISEMRMEEMVGVSLDEISQLSAEELLKEIPPFVGKLQLNRLVVKDLLGPIPKRNPLIQNTLDNLSKELGISEKQLIKELKDFRDSGYRNHRLFELSEDKEYYLNEKYLSPYEILKMAKKEYILRQEEEERKSMKSDEMDEIESLIKDLSEMKFEQI